MCDEEFDFMVLSSIIFNNVNQDKRINPFKYSLKMFVMMTIYNLLDLLQNSQNPHKDILHHNLINVRYFVVLNILLIKFILKNVFIFLLFISNILLFIFDFIIISYFIFLIV